MKKTYEKPFFELVKFDYSEQVIVASDGIQVTDTGTGGCTNPHPTNEGTSISSCNWQA